MRTVILVMAVCALCVASVVRDTRSIPQPKQDKEAKNESEQVYCAPQTPCHWVVYNTSTRIIDTGFDNKYCICSSDKECVFIEDDLSISSYIYKCRTPKPESNSTGS